MAQQRYSNWQRRLITRSDNHAWYSLATVQSLLQSQPHGMRHTLSLVAIRLKNRLRFDASIIQELLGIDVGLGDRENYRNLKAICGADMLAWRALTCAAPGRTAPGPQAWSLKLHHQKMRKTP